MALAKPATDSSFSPRFRIVFIMPGIEAAAPGANRNQKRILPVAELFAGFLFEHGDVLPHFVHQAGRQLACPACSRGRSRRW